MSSYIFKRRIQFQALSFPGDPADHRLRQQQVDDGIGPPPAGIDAATWFEYQLALAEERSTGDGREAYPF
jgi:hypothetical protein